MTVKEKPFLGQLSLQKFRKKSPVAFQPKFHTVLFYNHCYLLKINNTFRFFYAHDHSGQIFAFNKRSLLNYVDDSIFTCSKYEIGLRVYLAIY